MSKTDIARSLVRPIALGLFTAYYVWYGVMVVLGLAVNAPPQELTWAFVGTLGLWLGERMITRLKGQ